MKLLIALAAAGTLLAAVTTASAQSTQPASPNLKSAGNGNFCLNNNYGQPSDCKFPTMAACEKMAKPNGAQCTPNPRSTTGSGKSGMQTPK